MLAGAWLAWVDLRAAAHRAEGLLRKTVAHIQHRHLAGAWQAWHASFVAHRERAAHRQAALEKAARRLLNHRLSAGFDGWVRDTRCQKRAR
eukprot:SAG22_NODE_11137_length_499_cov_0.617500_1_plen_90_part_10